MRVLTQSVDYKQPSIRHTHTHTGDPSSLNASPVAQSFSSNSLLSLETVLSLFNTTWSTQSLVFFFFHLLLAIYRYKLVTP
ncbi:unnamed protein product [Hymenolepis diminuta]|uniref:Uncharacterized protein n=1 Tax=Hymenolepis diminuta TaxID=6216 RepID=A0A564Y9X0_HYMDI|nr:unnamed protein product [Hymenolepis diminuta]